MSKVKSKKSTSWGRVASWYDELLEKEAGTYQKEVILPNILRLLDIKARENVLDLACGQGFFSREFAKAGAEVVGVDISSELIEIAKGKSPNIKYFVSPAHKLGFIESSSIDKIAIMLAIQNIENIDAVLSECSRVLRSKGKLLVVLNHPAFRIPKRSSWDYDEKSKAQYRRIGGYMSESKVEIQMHPGEKPSEVTVSFHRPLQVYFKALKKAGFAVTGLEEWISNKKSQPGPRAKAEDTARKEIPLFMMLEATNIKTV